MAKQVCDLAAGKGMTSSQSDEHLRRAKTALKNKKWSGNYDPSREHLNFEVVKGGFVKKVDKEYPITRRISDNLKRRGIVNPNAGLEEPKFRTVANFILGGSRGQMHRLAFGNQVVNLDKGSDNTGIVRMKDIEDWAVDMYKFMARKFGEDNIAAFIVHLDEMNPHVHCTVLPVTERNKISWKKVIAGADKFEYRDRMLKLHDELAEVNKKYQLERGENITRTKAKHRTLEEYHQWAQKDLKTKVEGMRSEVYSLEQRIDQKTEDLKRAETKLKGLTTMIANLEAIHVSKSAELDKLKAQLLDTNSDFYGVMDKINRVQSELSNIEKKLDDKRSKLQLAEGELEELLIRKTQTEDSNLNLSKEQDHLMEQITNMKTKVQEQEINNMNALALEFFNNEKVAEQKRASAFEDQASDEEKATIAKYNNAVSGDNLLSESLSKTNDIIAVATALYFGYVSQALLFAKSHGGGGGGVPSDWGRKKDEDDWAWRRRSFGMALHLMKPIKKRSIKR